MKTRKLHLEELQKIEGGGGWMHGKRDSFVVSGPKTNGRRDVILPNGHVIRDVNWTNLADLRNAVHYASWLRWTMGGGSWEHVVWWF